MMTEKYELCSVGNLQCGHSLIQPHTVLKSVACSGQSDLRKKSWILTEKVQQKWQIKVCTTISPPTGQYCCMTDQLFCSLRANTLSVTSNKTKWREGRERNIFKLSDQNTAPLIFKRETHTGVEGSHFLTLQK